MTKLLQITQFLFLLFLTNYSYAQFAFGVEPGIGLKNAYFGYKTSGNFLPYFSLQLASGKVVDEYGGETDKYSATFVLPTIGTKYYLKQNNKLSPYLNAFVSKPFAIINSEGDDSNDAKLNAFAGGAGFGTEYFFDPRFSVGGEFGLMFFSAKEKYNYDDFGGGVSENATKYSVSPTYAKISLNFYFKK